MRNPNATDESYKSGLERHRAKVLEDFDKKLKDFSWLEKYAPMTLDYRCYDDCRMEGCPGHAALCTIHHATDSYTIKFHNQEIRLDNSQMAVILEWAEIISRKNKAFISQAIDSTARITYENVKPDVPPTELGEAVLMNYERKFIKFKGTAGDNSEKVK